MSSCEGKLIKYPSGTLIQATFPLTATCDRNIELMLLRSGYTKIRTGCVAVDSTEWWKNGIDRNTVLRRIVTERLASLNRPCNRYTKSRDYRMYFEVNGSFVLSAKASQKQTQKRCNEEVIQLRGHCWPQWWASCISLYLRSEILLAAAAFSSVLSFVLQISGCIFV